MNHLAHFLLSASEEDLLIGSFLGDFIKGRLVGEYPHSIERGMRLHRAIDAFTDHHETVLRSCRRPAPEFRRVAPIMVDIIYDYFLANHWRAYHPESMSSFSTTIFSTVLNTRITLPTAAFRLINLMEEHRSLAGYDQVIFVERAFNHLSKRLSRSNPLARGISEFHDHYSGFEEDFIEFYPILNSFVEQWLRDN